MTNLTADQLALVAHIAAGNQKALAEFGRGTGMLVEEAAHWAEDGITTVEQFEHSMAVETYINVYKDIHNIKPRGMDFSTMTATEVYAAVTEMCDYAEDSERRTALEKSETRQQLSSSLSVSEEDLERWGVV